MPARPRRFFDCSNCPAHCCAYDHIAVTDADARRLGRKFGLDLATVRRRFLMLVEHGKLWAMRHRKDKIFGSACRFLDRKSRQCTIYDARPRVCRDYPGTPRCGFYDFLMAERRSQEDPKHVPSFTRR